MKNLPVSTQTNTPAIKLSQTEMSIYSGTLNTDCVISNVVKIKKAFPALPIGFYEVFDDRLREHGFNDDRLRDAVNHVIDTCPYPNPTIANFISFDKMFKIYTYDEMLKRADEGTGASLKALKFPDRDYPVWAHVDDIKKYCLKSLVVE